MEGKYLEMCLFVGYVKAIHCSHGTLSTTHTTTHTQRTPYTKVCSVYFLQRTMRHHSGRHDETIQGQTEGLMPGHVVCVCVVCVCQSVCVCCVWGVSERERVCVCVCVCVVVYGDVER